MGIRMLIRMFIVAVPTEKGTKDFTFLNLRPEKIENQKIPRGIFIHTMPFKFV